jgi:hypothetical protein
LQAQIKETEGFISIFGNEHNMFSQWLDSIDTALRQEVVQSFVDELNALNALSPNCIKEEIDTLHQSFEVQRELLIHR